MSFADETINKMRYKQASNRRKQRHSKLMQKYDSFGTTWEHSYEKTELTEKQKEEIGKRLKNKFFSLSKSCNYFNNCNSCYWISSFIVYQLNKK